MDKYWQSNFTIFHPPRARCLKHWYPIFTANKHFVSENKPVYYQLIQHILKKVLEFFTVFIFALALKLTAENFTEGISTC